MLQHHMKIIHNINALVEKQIPKDKNRKKYVGKYVKFGKITIEILGVEGQRF